MITRSSKEQIDEYRTMNAVNQSMLKLLSVSGQAFLEVKQPEMFFEEKEHFLIGSAVDDFITMGEEYWDNNYHVTNIVKPSEVIMSIVQQVFHSRTSDDWFQQDLLSAIDAHNYQSNWKPETKVKKVSEEGERYWLELINSENKTVIDVNQYAKVQSIVNQLLTHNYTKGYFIGDKDRDIYYQVPIYFTLEDINVKALLDMIIVDHETGTIYPIDIKTIGDYTKNFDYQCYRRRYDIQASFYTEAVNHWKNQNFFSYKVSNFRFIVASTTKQCEPITFITTSDFISAGKYGSSKMRAFRIGEVQYNSEYYMYGYKKLIDIYKWHLENGFDKDYDVNANMGVFSIGSDYQRF